MKISYIGVDVGGTFTDAVGMAVDGTTARAKASTTPQAHVDGILNSLDRALLEGRRPFAGGPARRRGEGVGRNHGCDERDRPDGAGAGPACLVTKGFRDTSAHRAVAPRPDRRPVRPGTDARS